MGEGWGAGEDVCCFGGDGGCCCEGVVGGEGCSGGWICEGVYGGDVGVAGVGVAAVGFYAAVSAGSSHSCGVCICVGCVEVGAAAAITRDFGVAGEKTEHGCLVDTVVWGGAWVVAMFDDSIAPWS